MFEPPDYDAFFHRYARAYQASLGDRVEVELIRSFFAESFLAASTLGGVNVGANDDAFARTLETGYAFYKAIGTKRMAVERIEVEPLYEAHDRVRVFYVAEYDRPDGASITIPFDVLYLLQRRKDGPKIFAFIAGDETALYREHGLMDAEGRPA